jgi:hypothetical protein
MTQAELIESGIVLVRAFLEPIRELGAIDRKAFRRQFIQAIEASGKLHPGDTGAKAFNAAETMALKTNLVELRKYANSSLYIWKGE